MVVAMPHCYDLDGISPFHERAEAFATARPSYPEDAIEFVLSQQPTGMILDVGAGTGIGSIQLARHDRSVIAVDPNLSMIRASQRPDRVAFVVGRAENLPFGRATTSLLTVFNAFHWFQPGPFFAEAHRVIQPGGTLAVLWNEWDRRDSFTADFFQLMRTCAGDRPPEDLDAEAAPLYQTNLFHNLVRRSFGYSHRLDRRLLGLRLQSVSYVPSSGAEWERLDRGLDELYDKFKDEAGCVHHRYVTSVFVAGRLE